MPRVAYTTSAGPRPIGDPLGGLVGQTLLIGFDGTRVDDGVRRLLRQLRPGGLVLFPRNVVSVAQVADLTTDLQAAASDAGLPRLLIAVDQEGGPVLRLSSAAGFTDLPSAMALGRAATPAVAQALATATAEELSAVGITVVFAPVADLALDARNTVIGTRAFGGDPDVVAAFVVAVVTGLAAGGVVAVVKHFPGHGATHTDSHLSLPTLTASRAELLARDLVPFHAAVRAGVPGVMSAHVVSPLDPEVPATLSTRLLTDLLRREWAFDGLVISDSLEMKALPAAGFPPSLAAVRAVAAGVDMLVFDGDPHAIAASVEAICEAVRGGRLPIARLADAAARVAHLKETISVPRQPGFSDADRQLEAAAVARQVAADAFEIEDPWRLLPLRRPIVAPQAAGLAFARAIGWPVAGEADVDDPLVVVGEDEDWTELPSSLSSRSAVFVNLGVPRPLSAGGGAAVLNAFGVPVGLWSLVAARLTSTLQA